MGKDRSQCCQVILTASRHASSIALDELRATGCVAHLVRWLAPGVGLAALEACWEVLAQALHERPPIFLRHLCPAYVRTPVQQRPDDLERLAGALAPLIEDLEPALPFSVQTRLLGDGWRYGRYEVNQRLASVLQEQGAPLDVRRPAQVLSAVLTPSEAYLGLSRATDNLSDWAGGARRFKREAGQVSRAEFKLLEAVEVFGLHLPAGGSGLDLGAAPGGWTRILLKHDMRVLAVDPADLDPRVATQTAVRHVRQTAQRYLDGSDEQFDVLLNDMRMDALDSARVMLRAAGRLRGDGLAVMTCKLPALQMAETSAAALALLRRGYAITGARQLFHNRTEITVALSPRQ